MADSILSNGAKEYIDFASAACYQIHRAESLAAGALGMFQQGPAANTTQHIQACELLEMMLKELESIAHKIDRSGFSFTAKLNPAPATA